MKTKTYPCIVAFKKYRGHPNGWPQCRLCGEKAAGKVLIVNGWFRGDDTEEPRCENHAKSISLARP